MAKTSIQILPFSGHYADLQSLVNEIKQAQKGLFLDFENEANKTFYMLDDDAFEVVLSSNGEKVLIPNAMSYLMLFRGQTQDWGKCKSSLYRKDYDDITIFIQRLRLTEFCGIIESHPVIQRFFIKNNFRVSKVGLAQHYGLQTEMLDLTNDIDIAVFFAVCPYDKETDSYKTICDDQVHTGVIYAVFTQDYLTQRLDKFLDEKVSVIGLQPFLRPGSQKAFSLRLSNDEELFAFKYTFNYTNKDSEFYFKKYNNGESLWAKDEIASMIKPIMNQKLFSRKTLSKAFEAYPPKGYSKTLLIKVLEDYGIFISHKLVPDFYPSDKIQQVVQEWNTNQAKIMCKILQRRYWLNNEVVDEDGKKRYTTRHDFRTFQLINEMESLRLLGCHYKQKYFPIQSYDKIRDGRVASSKKNISINSDWIYVDGKVVLQKPETFLNEDDCKI
jgi:hypothetical protein